MAGVGLSTPLWLATFKYMGVSFRGTIPSIMMVSFWLSSKTDPTKGCPQRRHTHIMLKLILPDSWCHQLKTNFLLLRGLAGHVACGSHLVSQDLEQHCLFRQTESNLSSRIVRRCSKQTYYRVPNGAHTKMLPSADHDFSARSVGQTHSTYISILTISQVSRLRPFCCSERSLFV